jgi:hypothetical protein
MTILIIFQISSSRTLQLFYLHYVCLHLTRAFPHRVSYSRFVELEAEALLPLAAFLTTRLGHCTGLSFIDSTPLKVWRNLRIKSHKVFRDIAQRGVSSTGWFYGFKIHLVINDCRDLLAVKSTPGNVDDRKPVPQLARRLWGNSLGIAATSLTPSSHNSGPRGSNSSPNSKKRCSRVCFPSRIKFCSASAR